VAVGAFIAAVFSAGISANILRLLFVAFVVLVSTELWRGYEPKSTWRLPSAAGLVLCGMGIGVVSAWVGVGGGAMTVPLLIASRVPVRRAIGTSSAVGLPLALSGACGFVYAGLSEQDLPKYAIGFVHWPVLLMLASTSVLFANLGARMTERLEVNTLKRAFALLLLCGAAKMAWDVLKSWH
jgi:uncharacterized membrane protein YfcA